MTESTYPLDALGNRLQAQWKTHKGRRREIEDEWLKDLRQTQGKYEPTVKFSPGASQAFVPLTRVKVRTADARVGELVNPAVKDAWDIEPTPDPDLPEERKQFLRGRLAEAAQTLGQPISITEAHVERLEMEYARAAAKRMQRHIADGLVEADFDEVVAPQVYHSGHQYGVGILKGPLTYTERKRVWVRQADGSFGVGIRTRRRPYLECTSVWNFFPDMSARTLESSEFYYERHTYTKYGLRKLANRADFRAEPILAHIEAAREGDALWELYELEALAAGRNDGSSGLTTGTPSGLYEVLEFWGLLDASDLEREGVKVPEELKNMVLEANLWFFGATGKVIKAALNPFEKDTRPYSFYTPEPEEMRPFGFSIPHAMRDGQSIYNASFRMALDNASSAVSPQYLMHQRRLVGNKDPGNLWPGRMWFVTGETGETSQAIETVDAPIHTATFLQLAQVAKMLVDEGTGLPSFQHGDSSPGVGRTVGGLSMLMGAANLVLKENVRAWDRCMRRAIGLMYDWYMQFGDDPLARGDFKINVRGASSVMAREFRSEKLEVFAERTANPLDAPFVNRYELLRERADALEVNPRVVKTEAAVQAEQAAAAQAPGGMDGNGSERAAAGGLGDAPTGKGKLPDAGGPAVPGAEAGGEQGPVG